MTRKHFRELAEILRNHKGRLSLYPDNEIMLAQHKDLTREIALFLARQNKRFDWEKFLDAAGEV